MIVLLLYSWTTLSLFWQVPSWLYFMNAGEIFQIFAYAYATSLIEGFTILLAIVTLSIVLPGQWLRDRLVARGSALAIVGLSFMMFVAFQWDSKAVFPRVALSSASLVAALAMMVLAVHWVDRIHRVRRVIERFAEQATVFLFIFVPLGVIALGVVLIRLAV